MNGISSYIPEFEGEVREGCVCICLARLYMGSNLRDAQVGDFLWEQSSVVTGI